MAPVRPPRLTYTRAREIFDYDPSGFLIWRERRKGRVVGQRAGCVLNNGYVQITAEYEKYLAHRLIWFWHTGDWPPALDHIDRDRANNRIENLRVATKTQNAGNRCKQRNKDGNSSKWRGVYWCNSTNRWIARLQAAGRNPHIGAFVDEADAATAYNFAAAVYFGEFASFNCAEQVGI